MRGGDPLDEFYVLPYRISREGRRAARLVLRAVIDEGRRFAATPEGQEVAHGRAGSRLLKNGKVLWTMAGMDELLVEEPDVEL
jgi:hypothetical protein